VVTRTVVAMVACVFLGAALGGRVVRAQSEAWQPVERGMVRIAQPSDADFESANGGTRTWRVRFNGNDLEAEPMYSPREPPRVPFDPAINTVHLGSRGTKPNQAIHISNAWFLAYNFGEFGGGLWVFSTDGTVGRRLVDGPVFNLLEYRGEILVVTVPNVMMFTPPLRIHRFGLRNGRWDEIGHTDFANNMRVLRVGAGLYGVVRTQSDQVLAEVGLDGGMHPRWRLPENASVSNVAVTSSGDIAVGGFGFVARLHRRGNGFEAVWYAPRDCVRYKRDPDDRDDTNTRCVGIAGTRSYERQRLAPITPYWFSSDGRWILARGIPQRLFRVLDPGRVDEVPLPSERSGFFQRVEALDDEVVLAGSKSLWRRRDGQWSRISTEWCLNLIALDEHIAWCTGNSDDAGNAPVFGLRYDGLKITPGQVHGAPQLIVPGFSSDAWISERDAALIGHVSPSGTQELSVSSPVQSISRGRDVIWFSEADEKHYGYVDARNAVHEFDAGQSSRTQWIRGATKGAWLRETFSESRTLVRHIDYDGSTGYYAPDVRSQLVTADGVFWGQSNDWPVVMRLTEGGELARYSLPCADARVTLRAGPQNGVWFFSQEPHCSGFIDVNGISVRDLPSVETVFYR
jgi:hypothetical protein